jgi:hypothetical protein
MKKYKIEAGVALPERGRENCPFDRMKVGESFEFSRDDWRNVNSQRSYWRRCTRKNWTIRRTD